MLHIPRVYFQPCQDQVRLCADIPPAAYTYAKLFRRAMADKMEIEL